MVYKEGKTENYQGQNFIDVYWNLFLPNQGPWMKEVPLTESATSLTAGPDFSCQSSIAVLRPNLEI